MREINGDMRRHILEAYNSGTTPRERRAVLVAVEAALHEIRSALLEQEPTMRNLVRQIDTKISGIVSGRIAGNYQSQTSSVIASEIGGHTAERIGTNGIADIATQIEIQLAMRHAHHMNVRRELKPHTHAFRIQEAADVAYNDRVGSAIVKGSATGYCDPIDPTTVACRICGAKVGEKCVGLASIGECDTMPPCPSPNPPKDK